ncbi:MAG: phosphodiester glycosidase family protein [Armatimonadota bacterium]
MKKLVLATLGLALFFLLTCTFLPAEPVDSETLYINGFKVNVVSIDTKDPSISIKPAVAYGKKKYSYPNETFGSFVKRTKPVAAINGTYHDTNSFKPTGTIIVDGEVENIGCVGTVVGFTYKGDIQFHLASSLKKYFIPWNTFEHAVCTGPTLVYKNSIYLNPKEEGFRDPRVLGYAKRSVLGYTGDDKLLLVTIRDSVNLKETAKIMLKLNCAYAVCLDGGGSSALYHDGEYLTYSDRKVTNFVSVNYNEPEYAGFIQVAGK